MAVLSTGASGAEVAALQAQLQALGFAVGPADGKMGPRTVAALQQFQTASGMEPTGVYDLATQGTMAAHGAVPGQPVQGPAGASQKLSPYGDTQFLAYQRALGQSENEAYGANALAVGRAQRDLALRLPVLAENERSAGQGIDNSYEQSGFFNSGNRKLEQARNTTEFGRQRGMAELGTADTIADSNANLASQVAAGRRGAAEEGIAGSQRRATTRAGLGLS